MTAPGTRRGPFRVPGPPWATSAPAEGLPADRETAPVPWTREPSGREPWVSGPAPERESTFVPTLPAACRQGRAERLPVADSVAVTGRLRQGTP